MSYKKELDKIVWSFSTLNQYCQCPYAFYNKKLDTSELDESNYYAEIGGFIHEILAMLLTGELSLDDSIAYFQDNYDNNVVYEVKQSTMEKKYELAIDYLASLDSHTLDKYEILGVEKKVLFKVNKYNFVGYIDLLLRDKETKKIILVDHKSTDHFMKKDGVTPLKSTLKEFEAYKRQAYLYCRSIYEEYGEYPNKIIWNHFFEQQFTDIPFNQDDYENSLKWAIDTIKKIYKDKEFVANKGYMTCYVLCGFRNSCCYKEVDSE